MAPVVIGIVKIAFKIQAIYNNIVWSKGEAKNEIGLLIS